MKVEIVFKKMLYLCCTRNKKALTINMQVLYNQGGEDGARTHDLLTASQTL